MIYNQKTRDGKTYIWGFIWGQPRSIAVDEAQIRQCNRDLENLKDAVEKGKAA